MFKKIFKKQKVFFSILMVLIGMLFTQNRALAVWAGDAIAAELMHEAWWEAYNTFRDTMIANLKIQANRIITDRIELLISGHGSSRPLIITDYQDFIFKSAQRQTTAMVNDLFRSIKSDASAVTKEVLAGVETAVTNEINGQEDDFIVTIDDYVTEGKNAVFDQTKGSGTAATAAYFANDMNNPYGAYLKTSTAAETALRSTQTTAQTEAIAGQGFISKVDPNTNLIELPGVVLKDLTTYAETLPMRMVVFARSIPEVVGQLAAQIVSQTINMGIAKVTEPIDNAILDARSAVAGGVSEIQDDIYDGINFSD